MSERAARRERVDWAELRRRIDELGRTISGAQRQSPESVRAVLEERARRLARPPSGDPEGDAMLDLVLFERGGETFGVDAARVVEVGAYGRPALLPGSPQPIVGIVAWRGELLALLDLGLLFSLSAADTAPGHLLVLGDERPAFGVAVDAIGGLQRVAAHRVRPPDWQAGRGGRHLRGVTDDAVLVIDADDLIHTYRTRSAT